MQLAGSIVVEEIKLKNLLLNKTKAIPSLE
jgi:hypothetical protein